MQYEQELTDILLQNAELQEIFSILHEMHLPNAFVCAGAIRTLIWNHQTKHTTSLVLGNIDVYYQSRTETAENHQILSTLLNQKYSKYLWELNNISLFIPHKGIQPTGETIEQVLTQFPETCSAIGVNIDVQGNLTILAPFGLQDLFEMRVNPTPHYASKNESQIAFMHRINRKNWQQKWPELELKY